MEQPFETSVIGEVGRAAPWADRASHPSTASSMPVPPVKVPAAMLAPVAPVAVFGAGGVGLSIVMAARLVGAGRIVVVDPVPAKLDFARAFGATGAVSAGPDAAARVRALASDRGADVAFETSGRPDFQEQALDGIRPGGLLVLVGLAPMGIATNLPGALLVHQEKTVAGSYYAGFDEPPGGPLLPSACGRGRSSPHAARTRMSSVRYRMRRPG
jgi:threonine dehydrogenase-like Zn-dependent dehydrogenase